MRPRQIWITATMATTALSLADVCRSAQHADAGLTAAHTAASDVGGTTPQSRA